MEDGVMDSREPGEIILQIPPWPAYMGASYRFFEKDERHVTRICRHYVLIFMLERALLFSEDGQERRIEAGEWYIQVPGRLQEGKQGSPAPVYYYIHFKGCDVRLDGMGNADPDSAEDGQELVHLALPVRGLFDPVLLRPLFEQLESLSRRMPADILGQQAVFLTILNQLTAGARPAAEKRHALAVGVMEYLAQHYYQPVSSADLENQFHFTADYLARRMKQYTGITPWEYLRQIRVERAKELLTNTEYKLPLIAMRVGYNDLSVFYKAFKKQTGLAPGIWRIRNRGLE